MKHLAKRGLALLLALILCAGLLTAAAASVEYTMVDTAKFSDVIVNWGQRETVATFLSPNAVAFYEENGLTYEMLSAINGAEDVDEVPESPLYDVLQELMMSNHTVITSYEDTKQLYTYTDCQNSDPSAISSFYSGKSVGPAWDSGKTWNREHTWPNSKGFEGSDEDDIMMLRPTASSENGSRGNKAYGESAGYFDPNKASNYAHDVRGDVARIMLYVYVRWGNTQFMWGSQGVMESAEVLLKWMEEDPVDTWEMGRNDSVQSVTGTRNVFVDYPELAFLLFAEEIPAGMPTPTFDLSEQSKYAVTAESDDESLGTVTVSGSIITAIPAAGYEPVGYTAVSGSADVRQEGNTFVVSAESDCVIRILFAAEVSAEITFIQNGAAAVTQTSCEGGVITLPGHSGDVPEGCTFLGWVTSPVEQTRNEPQSVLTAGQPYEVDGDADFYALYSWVTEDGDSNVYKLVEEQTLTEGDYIFVYNSGAMRAAILSNRLNFSDITITNDTITAPAEDLVWHISYVNDDQITIYNEATGQYAAGTGKKNNAGLVKTVTDFALWEPEFRSAGTFEFCNVGNDAKGINCWLRRNSGYGFACYSTSTGGALTLYKASGETVWFGTTIEGVPADVLYGDVNGDGVVATLDLAMLRRYLANVDPVTGLSSVAVQAGADTNGDGSVTVTDLAMLRRYLANVDPVTGLSSVVLGPAV